MLAAPWISVLLLRPIVGWAKAAVAFFHDTVQFRRAHVSVVDLVRMGTAEHKGRADPRTSRPPFAHPPGLRSIGSIAQPAHDRKAFAPCGKIGARRSSPHWFMLARQNERRDRGGL